MPTEVGGTEIGLTPEPYVHGWVKYGLGFWAAGITKVRPCNGAVAQPSVPLTLVGCEAKVRAFIPLAA